MNEISPRSETCLLAGHLSLFPPEFSPPSFLPQTMAPPLPSLHSCPTRKHSAPQSEGLFNMKIPPCHSALKLSNCALEQNRAFRRLHAACPSLQSHLLPLSPPFTLLQCHRGLFPLKSSCFEF